MRWVKGHWKADCKEFGESIERSFGFRPVCSQPVGAQHDHHFDEQRRVSIPKEALSNGVLLLTVRTVRGTMLTKLPIFLYYIMYNPGWYATGIAGGVTIDIIGNEYKQGPTDMAGGRNEVAWRSDYNGPNSGPSGPPSIYIAKNKGWSVSNPASDN